MEAERPEQMICLGDVATIGPQPCEVVERLWSLGYAVVAILRIYEPQPTAAADEDWRKVEAIDRW